MGAARLVERAAPMAMYLALAAGGALASGVGITITDGGIGTGCAVAWMVWVSKELIQQGVIVKAMARRFKIKGG